jgi:hypothetical protein
MRRNLDYWLFGLGASLLSTAVVVAMWECPSERDDYVQGLWTASGIALLAVIATGAGVVMWFKRRN